MTVRDLEARIAALERKLPGNPGPGFVKADGVELKEHLEGKIAAVEKAGEARLKEQRDFVEMKFVTLQRAIDKASEEEKAKFLTVNEFRGTLTDYTTTLASKDKVEAMFEALAARIMVLERAQSRAEGKASQSSVIVGYVISGLALALSLVKLFGGI